MFVGRGRVIESQRQADQQNIMLNNSSIIFPTSDEEMRHARNANDDNSSNDQ